MKHSSGQSAGAGEISAVNELQNGRSIQQIQMQIPASHFGGGAAAVSENDDFMDQMLSGMAPSSWPDLGYPLPAPANGGAGGVSGKLQEDVEEATAEGIDFVPYVDDSLLLAERLRQHQIGALGGRLTPGSKPLMLQLMNHQHHQTMQSVSGGADLGLFSLPMGLRVGGAAAVDDGGIFQDMGSERMLDGGGFSGGSLHGAAEAVHQQHFQNFAGPVAMQAGVAGQPTAAAAPPPRQKVRARRGQATDPHSIAERLRRERIAERMKALQELVPNANKTDKASMLDEIIDYVKFLQLQVKVLSTSRLTAPVVGENSSEQSGGAAAADLAGDDQQVAVAEQQVVKLMEEDMGTAMQYLQGKGLCLMPISLASTISAAAAARRRHHQQLAAFATSECSSPSPSMSVLTVQGADSGGALPTSVYKP